MGNGAVPGKVRAPILIEAIPREVSGDRERLVIRKNGKQVVAAPSTTAPRRERIFGRRAANAVFAGNAALRGDDGFSSRVFRARVPRRPGTAASTIAAGLIARRGIAF
ncbi:MAG: hypothetical protein ACLPN5_08300 [Roseiarcus sp.]